MASRPLVALICLDGEACRGLGDYLMRHGYEVCEVEEEWAADAALTRRPVDIAIIGEGMASGAGLDLLRRHGTPDGPSFVVISTGSDLIERVLALELGAADVVQPPVNWRELTARVAGLVNRRGRGARELMVLENATVDLKAALVMHHSGREEQLSPGQVALLRLFMASPRRVLSRDDIIAAAPAESADAFDRSIDSRIVRLRRKLDTETITTIRGSGYRFDPPQHDGT